MDGIYEDKEINYEMDFFLQSEHVGNEYDKTNIVTALKILPSL